MPYKSRRQYVIGTFFLVLFITTIVIIWLRNTKQAAYDMETENQGEKLTMVFLLL